MPGQSSQPAPGGNPSNNNQGQNTITIEDDVKIEEWMACVERIGEWYASTVTTYLAGSDSKNFNKNKSEFTDSLGRRLETYGFTWSTFDGKYVPQRGEISVQHGYYYNNEGKEKDAKHVEVVADYDENTKRSYIWSWGQVNPTLPSSRTNWTTRTSGCWRITQ